MIRTSLIAAAAALAIAPASLMASSVVNATYNGTVYRVYLPDSYTANGADIPVTLYLHSAAERGNSVNDIFSNSYGGQTWNNDWINGLIQETQHGDHQSILIMPQSGLGAVWSSTTAGDNWGSGNYTGTTATTTQLANAIQITKNVVANYNTDSNRVYVTGPSMGGYGTWEAVAKNPDLFAAAMPFSGAGNLDLAKTVLASKPIWAYTGANDGLIPASNTIGMYFAMKQAGGSPIITDLANTGHGGWDILYNDQATTDKPYASGGSGQSVYDWLFSQTLDHPVNATPMTAGNAAVVIGFSAGAAPGTGRGNYTASGKSFISYNLVVANQVSNLTDVNNFQTGISVKLMAGALGPGNSTVTVSGQLADQITNDCRGALYTAGVLSGSDKTIIYQISGLEDGKQYKFDVFGSTNAAVGQSVYTLYTLVGDVTRTATINVANNTGNLFTVMDLYSVNGIVTLKVDGVGSDLGYISSLIITPVVVPEPTTMGLLAVGAMGLLRRRRANV